MVFDLQAREKSIVDCVFIFRAIQTREDPGQFFFDREILFGKELFKGCQFLRRGFVLGLFGRHFFFFNDRQEVVQQFVIGPILAIECF